MSSDIAVRVIDLSKRYNVYEKPQDRLKQSFMPRLQRRLGLRERSYNREFWALRGVTFEVPKGQTVGIIGRNGSGKSTLLQMICGTLTPTQGSVETQGRVAALLELGSGFNPDFSGRDNVYMNAAILGLDKAEIDKRFDAIVEFADIGDFINEPIKTYSSGMMVRLAFSVQAQIDPDILIVDEALAVGDARFQAKCFDRLRQLKENGTSILLVTHSSEQIVAHCDSAILIEGGKIIESGLPKSVVNRYHDVLFGSDSKKPLLVENHATEELIESPEDDDDGFLSTQQDIYHTREGYNKYEYRWGDQAASILDFKFSSGKTLYPPMLESGNLVSIEISVRFNATLINPIFGLTVKSKEGLTLYGSNSELLKADAVRAAGQAGSTIRIRSSFKASLAPGDYFLSLGIATRDGETITPHDRRYDSIHFCIKSPENFFGLAQLDMSVDRIVVAN